MDTQIGILAKLPAELWYLVEPAMKYGIHQTDDERQQFLDHATRSELEELSRVAERIRVNDHNDLIAHFRDKYPMTEYPESANLYFLFGVMDAAGLRWIPDHWNSVHRHITALTRFGSFRLASERMWAARFLAESADNAELAIPHLRRATQDQDLRVRVWAHYALGVLEQRATEHEDAIRRIYQEHNRQDESGDYVDDIGLEAHTALEKLGEMKQR